MKTAHVTRTRLALLLPLVCATTVLSGAATPSSASVTVGRTAPAPGPAMTNLGTAYDEAPELTTTARQAARPGAAITTSVSLTTSLNPSGGQNVTFTATVSGGPGVADGVVAFADWGRLIGTSGIQAGDGSASMTTSSLADGLHAIKAYYIATSGYTPSNSPPVYQLVQLGR